MGLTREKLQGILNIIVLSWLLLLTITVFFDRPVIKEEIHDTDTIYLKEEIRFDTMQANIANMLKVCDSLNIKFPKIVVSQAILESGNFKSKLFNKTNNPLGLYDSKNNRYYSFNHWTDAIYVYQNKIEYKHRDGEDYYDFLNRIGYADDKNYINKVKQIEKYYELH